MLQQLLELFGELLRVGTDFTEDFNSRSDVLFGSGKRLRPRDSYLEELVPRKSAMNPGDVEASVNSQELVTSIKSFFYFFSRARSMNLVNIFLPSSKRARMTGS